MTPTKTLNRLIDDAIENEIDAWVDSKWHEPQQLELIEEEEC